MYLKSSYNSNMPAYGTRIGSETEVTALPFMSGERRVRLGRPAGQGAYKLTDSRRPHADAAGQAIEKVGDVGLAIW